MAPSTSVNPLLSDYIKNDKTPWYKKKNLRDLYLLLLPAAIGVEMTSGFDSSMMNGLQAIDPWVACIFFLQRNSKIQTSTNPVLPSRDS